MGNALAYEDIKFKASKGIGKKVAIEGLDRFHSTTLLKYLIVKHKFGLLATFTVIYVSFSLCGTLIVGLIEGLK